LSRTLAEPIQIRVRQAIIPRFRAFVLPLMLVSVAATGLSAWQGSLRSSSLAWSAFGLACVMPALTIAVNVPINRRILQWSPDAAPHHWREEIARWDWADRVRLLLGIAAFLCAELS
jgi:hypothetical protein